MRKLFEVAHYFPNYEPGEGDEVTYTEFVVRDAESVRALAEGRVVELRYCESEAD